MSGKEKGRRLLSYDLMDTFFSVREDRLKTVNTYLQKITT